jgi:hypothetical protein
MIHAHFIQPGKARQTAPAHLFLRITKTTEAQKLDTVTLVNE